MSDTLLFPVETACPRAGTGKGRSSPEPGPSGCCALRVGRPAAVCAQVCPTARALGFISGGRMRKALTLFFCFISWDVGGFWRFFWIPGWWLVQDVTLTKWSSWWHLVTVSCTTWGGQAGIRGGTANSVCLLQCLWCRLCDCLGHAERFLFLFLTLCLWAAASPRVEQSFAFCAGRLKGVWWGVWIRTRVDSSPLSLGAEAQNQPRLRDRCWGNCQNWLLSSFSRS